LPPAAVFHDDGGVIEKQGPGEHSDTGIGLDQDGEKYRRSTNIFLLSSAVVFHDDGGVIEKQGPDEQSDIGIGLDQDGERI
jgi:hypothetical protein